MERSFSLMSVLFVDLCAQQLCEVRFLFLCSCTWFSKVWHMLLWGSPPTLPQWIPCCPSNEEGNREVYACLCPVHSSPVNKSFSPPKIKSRNIQDIVGGGGGRQCRRKEGGMRDDEEKEPIHLSWTFSLLLYSFICSLFSLSDPRAIRGLPSGGEARRLHLFFILPPCASLPPLPSRALPLLTFENQNLQFEFQSELADTKKDLGRAEE